MASSEIVLEAVSSVSQIPAEDWDCCANPGPHNGLDRLASPNTERSSCADLTFSYNPFVSHAFFSALEASGSAFARTGWGPRHLLARLDGAIVGIVPCYLKSHSQGEYVFDRGWADAYERAGGHYYPQLQVSDTFTGSHSTEDAWAAFFAFYMQTGSRKWGRPYLTRSFFSLIGETMAEDVALIMARRNGRWIAGAINFIGSDTLFGRNWGAIEHHPFLHFEVCYYQAIDFAIRRSLKTVEAGAQGEHKIARGYLPQTTYSAHYIAHPDLRRSIADYLSHEPAYVAKAARDFTAPGRVRQTADYNMLTS